jgi:hypothetical protein
LILDFLEQHDTLSLIYLQAVGFHGRYEDLANCVYFNKTIYDNKCFSTKDKTVFMQYASRMWGFLSCFICLSEAYKNIGNCEQFKRTNWLQSYIHIRCADYGEKNLGVIGIPCIGAGIYNIVSNCDSAQVDGICYQNMLKYAIEYGFDRKQLRRLFVWRICFIFKRSLIKERASNISKSKISNLIKSTWKYPEIWFLLYPVLLVPPFVCKHIVGINNRRKKYVDTLTLNRSGDICG